MSRSRFRLLLVVVAAALALPGSAAAWAQAQPAAENPAPQAPATPPPASTPEKTAPATPPSPAPADAAPTAPAAEAKTPDPFGEEVTLTPRTVVMLTGNASWETAFEALTGSFKKLAAALDKQNIAASGPFIVVYTSTDDAGFTYFTEIPIDGAPKDLPDGITVGQSPEGRMLKFIHRGSYDNMDNTYEAITNHLDARKLEARDMFIEEYVTDPLKTAEDKLVINVLVPLK
jgi:effector-binding domain-containing protein